MGTVKIILFMGLTGLLLSSCKEKKDTSYLELAELRQECNMLRQDRAKALKNNVEAQELIDNIFASINSISGRAASLERSVEENSGEMNRRKVDEIVQDIAIIKEKIERTEKMEPFDAGTQKVISNLKATIEQKQEEINELKVIIEQKEEQVSQLDHQVSSLDDELDQTNQQLRKRNAELANTKERLRENEMNAWLAMGDELISAAETLPEVKGHGNMKPIKAAKLTFILKANGCYQKALQLGSSTASLRISYANNLYRRTQ